MQFETTIPLATLLKSINLANELTPKELAQLGSEVHKEWEIDKTSRTEWEAKTKLSFDLALQVMEKKSFPWTGASNVKFPLVTIAALQYQARAYPALIPDNEIVKCRIVGEDIDGLKALRAERVSEHMSFQVLEEDEGWEEHMDRALIAQAIVGCAFKKSYFDPGLSHNVSEHILAKDLYIPYYAPSLEKAPRITQILYFTPNDLYERFNRGVFLDWNSEIAPAKDNSNSLEQARSHAQGVSEPSTDESQPFEILEQHRYLDLDGDGYQEPYIVYVRKDTKKVLRIVSRFQKSGVELNSQRKVVRIEPDHYFTKFSFIPSPDGGIYDLGFGVLLGPLNESINTTINQLIDAGTLSNTAGGFLGRGVKFRSGDNSFKPFEWKRVDSTGDDLRKGVFPLPVREPSAVLFNLLGMLINYGERVGGATDPQVGINPGQNTPAETSRNTLAEGQRVFNAIYKRTYRALKEEFRKLYKLNATYLDESADFFSISSGANKKVLWADYISSPKDIVPAADPAMVSDTDKLRQVQEIRMAAATAGGYNRYEVEKMFLQALKVRNIEQLLPDPKGPNAIQSPPDTKVVIAGMNIEVQKLDIMLKNKIAVANLMQEFELTQAKIEELRANATWTLAEAQGVDTGHQLAAINSAIGLAKAKADGIHKAMTILMQMQGNEAKMAQQGDSTSGNTTDNSGSGMGGMEGLGGNAEVPGLSAPTAEFEQGVLG